MWSEPRDSADGIVMARRPVTSVVRATPVRRAPPAPVRFWSDVEVRTFPIDRARASYRELAWRADGGLCVVIRTTHLGSSKKLAHQIGEVVLAVVVAAPLCSAAAAVLPPGCALMPAVFALTVISGGALGVLPGFGRALAVLYRKVTGGVATDLGGALETRLECRDGAALVVTRTPHGDPPSHVVVPTPALATLRADISSGRAQLSVCVADARVVLADDLSARDASALMRRLAKLAVRAA